jgi:hypothetical protein
VNTDNSDIVAREARETFLKIRQLRKTMPQFTRAEKDELQRTIDRLEDEWWNAVKVYMRGESF